MMRKFWKQEREKLQEAHPSHKVLLTNYAAKAATFMRQTGLVGQYKTLDEDQNDWTAGADVNQNDKSTKKRPGRRTGYATGPQGSKTLIETAARRIRSTADPFSIVNLVATAASLTKAIFSYVTATGDTPKEVEKLRQILASFFDVAEQFVDLVEDEDVKKDFGEVSSLYTVIEEFVVTLDRLQERLDKRAAEGIHKALDRLK
ncbi:hypothetical protein N7G274_002023 [Stereocaulon virgatum]|uniref:Fungal STAND N-terminal Goodbye domain-containing protein n=1 Tax=Stereocaulon virgatum TaxID=373712 RepID=A0ABR4AJG6_9LECA